jgi:hypothetical protein
MPSTFIAVPQFPSVPKLPGVPNLQRPIAALAATLPGIIASLQVQAPPGFLVQASKATPVWGVFDSSGNLAIAPQSIAAFGMRSEWRISDYPVQDGTFASYDKVTVPREIMVRMMIGKTLQDRVAFELACETVAASLDTYTIITPEKSYQNMNCLRHEVNRVETKGAYFIEAEMYFRQVNPVNAQYSTATAAAANTANAAPASAIPASSLGIVQPTTTGTPIQSAITSVLGPSPLPGLVD